MVCCIKVVLIFLFGISEYMFVCISVNFSCYVLCLHSLWIDGLTTTEGINWRCLIDRECHFRTHLSRPVIFQNDSCEKSPHTQFSPLPPINTPHFLMRGCLATSHIPRLFTMLESDHERKAVLLQGIYKGCPN